MDPITISYEKISSLNPWPDNPRIMTEPELERLVLSIQEFGLVDPIIVRRTDRLVIGGHQRVEAAERLGLTEVPVVFIDASDEKAQALNIALNKISGYFDEEKLAKVLAELQKEDIDISLTGFTVEEIEAMLNTSSAEPDSPPETMGDLDRFQNMPIKQIVTYFQEEEYLAVRRRLDEVIKKEKLENDGDALLKLMDIYKGGNS